MYDLKLSGKAKKSLDKILDNFAKLIEKKLMLMWIKGVMYTNKYLRLSTLVI